MDIISRVRNIILSPKTEWQAISDEKTDIKDIFIKYVMIVSLPYVVGCFIGFSVFGQNVMGFTSRLPLGQGFKLMIFTYVFLIATTFIFGLIIEFMAPAFDSEKNMLSSMKLAAYSSTPSFIAGALFIIPSFQIAMLFNSLGMFYSFYLLYLGLKPLKKVPDQKLNYYFGGLFIFSILITVIMMFVVKSLLTPSYPGYPYFRY